MDEAMAARCRANVKEAHRRAREAHPELAHESASERHARLQAQVPRMCAFINRFYREGLFRGGSREEQLAAWARHHQHQFAVEVAEDHAAMSRGEVSSTVFVTVLAEDAVEASLFAAQMASRHGIATSVQSMGR